nr:protein Smaug 1 [Hymenolepis microstoma]
MSHTFKPEDSKNVHNQIPIIYIENNCSTDPPQYSPPGRHLPTYMPDSEFATDRDLSLNNQTSQFLCWFGDLSSPKQFVYTVLTLQNISSDYLKLAHSLITYRLAEDFHHNNIATKAFDIEYLKGLDQNSDDFSATVLELLFSLDSSKDKAADLNQVHDIYLALVDKALENASQQKLVFDDICDSLEGQLLIVAMSTPLFTLEDRNFLRKNIKLRSVTGNSWQSAGLLNLVNELFEVFELNRTGSEGFLCPSKTLSRNVRSSSINSPFPFIPRSLHTFQSRRHHSLVPPTSENSLLVPSPFAMAHPFSSSTSSSPNSSGFVSGSESMYQGLNEPLTLSIRGNRLAAPSLSRLYLLRRQSASPYSPQEGELKEEDDSASSSGNPTKLDITGSCTSLLIPPQNEVVLSSFESSEGMTSDASMRQSEERSPVPCLTVSSPPPQTNVPGTPPPPQISCEEFTDQPRRSSISKELQRSGETLSEAASLRDGQFEDPGMAQIPVWLKSLRLHKYIGLFKCLTYFQMLGITDEWLQRQHVTQGARNKILVSIANLGTRSTTLTNLESLIETCAQNSSVRASNLRGCLYELRSCLQTPFPPSPSQPSAISPQRCISPTSSLEDTNFVFGSDVEDFVGVDDGDFDDFQPSSRSLCQCPCTNSDTCLFDRSGVGLLSPKRPKSSEGGAASAVTAVNTTEIEPIRQFFPSDNPNEQLVNTGEQEQQGAPSCKEAVAEENLSEQIMRCLNHGYKALLIEPVGNDDNYGFFMQLLGIVLDHPSFSRSQKDQVISWEKELVDRLGPAPPPPRRSSYHHHHRATSRRSSYQYSSPPYQGPPTDRGGSHSAPYTPRSSVGPLVLSRPYFTSPVRMSFLHPQSQQPTPHSPFLHTQSLFSSGGQGPRWVGGIVRGRSAEPDVYHHHHQGSGGMPLRATVYHEQQQAAAPPPPPPMMIVSTTHCGQPQQRVASMDSLTVVSTPYGLMEPYLTPAHPYLTRTRLISCHDPHVSSDLSAPSVSPFASPELHQSAAATGCFNLLPPPLPHSRRGVPEGAAFLSPSPSSQIQPPPQPGPSSQSSARWMGRASVSNGSSVISEYSTAEINRDLELLTEKVTKLAIEESDSPSE